MNRQCPSCGGFCKKSKCERENVKPKGEHEPVAWVTRRTGDGGVYVDGYETCESTDYGAIPVYTAPPNPEHTTEVVAVSENGIRTVKKTLTQKKEWVGLTDADIQSCPSWCGDQHDFAYEIEVKLKEKNT